MTAMLLPVTLGLLLVLVLRKPARRLFGAEAAFTLWLLPVLMAVLPWLPSVPATWAPAQARWMVPGARSLIDAVPDRLDLHWPILLWGIGSTLALLRLAWRYVHLMRHCRQVPTAMIQILRDELDASELPRLRLHPAGPAVLWAPRSRILLPADFLQRYTSVQRPLVLRHECMHLRRGDTIWNLGAELACALLWFHPLAWLALPRFRLDQELACDAAVLRQAPQVEADYAHTLLPSAGVNVTPVLIPWLAEPQLKERLTMIQQHASGARRRRIGYLGLALCMVGSAFAVQAATHDASRPHANPNLSFDARVLPQYPKDAIDHKQQGTVVLMVLVGKDGKPVRVKVDPSTQAAPSLVQAASDAAMRWHFNPAVKNGKPIESYAKVPVNFSLDDARQPPVPPLPPAAPGSLPPPPPPPPPAPPAPPTPSVSSNA